MKMKTNSICFNLSVVKFKYIKTTAKVQKLIPPHPSITSKGVSKPLLCNKMRDIPLF